MIRLRVDKSADGDVTVRWIPPALAHALRELPRLLADESASARTSQSPTPDDEEASDEWDRNSVPELRHLFVSAREIVLGDLDGLRLERTLPIFHRIEIPAGHVAAWLSSLAAARVGLGETHRITADDMTGGFPAGVPTARERGILLIQLLGWMQAILLGEEE